MKNKNKVIFIMAVLSFLMGCADTSIQEAAPESPQEISQQEEDVQDSKVLLVQASEQAEALEAYEKFLTDYAEQWKELDPGFALIYLDNNDIPELVIIDGWAHLMQANIYTYENGETVFIGNYGMYGCTSYQEKEGIIVNDFMAQGGVQYYSVIRIDGTQTTPLQFFCEEWEWDEEELIYSIDDEIVSKEQYEAALESWDNENEKIINYGMCTPIIDTDIEKALAEELEILTLTQKEILKENVLVKSGMEESAILLMDYDDYDRDGKYEAFVFCGECSESTGDKLYSGELWFAGVGKCTKLREGNYRMIDGQMYLGIIYHKFLYFDTDIDSTSVVSEIWTVENGELVESEVSRMGQVVYRGENYFEIWKDACDHFYEPDKDVWTGYTYKPYFYEYNEYTNQIERCEAETISKEQLKQLCGFDLAAEVEAEGYEITSIIKWGISWSNDIITVNYIIPAKDDDSSSTITYENIIWDCNTKDYWRKTERGVTSWKDAGVGGSF